MNIIEKFLTPNCYSRPGKKRPKTTKIAVHYVGNAGSSAIANRNYFESLKDKKLYASSHYIIGLEGEIIYCVPESEVAYTTNSANAYSIGIECCHPKSDGVFNELTRQALIELCADLCTRYNLNPLNDIIRHYDVTGKSCPLAWASNSGSKYADFIKFKQEVKDFMNKDEHKIKELKIKLYGEDSVVDAIEINGNNYCKLRDLHKQGVFEVAFDGKNVLINGTKFETNDQIVIDNTTYVKLQSLKDYLKIGYFLGVPTVDEK